MKKKGFGLNLLVGVGIVFFAIALLLFLKIIGLISPLHFAWIISWQMLLIVLGVLSLAFRQLLGGGVLIVTGIYFIIPRLSIAFNLNPLMDTVVLRQCYWVALLLIVALAFIFHKWVFGLNYRWVKKNFQNGFSNIVVNHSIEEGILMLKCVFGGAEHLVVEKPFKGAEIDNVFSGIRLDLRNTTLKDGDNFLDIKCVFGGIELLVPADWDVQSVIRPIFGSIQDSRSNSVMRSVQKRLILRGECVFGGVDIRSCREGEYDKVETTEEPHEEAVKDVETLESVTVKLNNRVHIVSVEDIYYIQADGDYVTICTAEGKFLKEQTMKYFEAALPIDQFVRIHRSYIVNITQITCIEMQGRDSYLVLLKGGASLKASISGYQLLKTKLAI